MVPFFPDSQNQARGGCRGRVRSGDSSNLRRSLSLEGPEWAQKVCRSRRPSEGEHGHRAHILQSPRFRRTWVTSYYPLCAVEMLIHRHGAFLPLGRVDPAFWGGRDSTLPDPWAKVRRRGRGAGQLGWRNGDRVVFPPEWQYFRPTPQWCIDCSSDNDDPFLELAHLCIFNVELSSVH